MVIPFRVLHQIFFLAFLLLVEVVVVVVVVVHHRSHRAAIVGFVFVVHPHLFVGVGFLLCSRDVALSILFITLYHEIAQELADFFILTKHAGLSAVHALALNFLSGLSVMLGGITVLAVKDLTSQAVGIILAIAAGVYIYIGASECIPRVDQQLHGWKDRVLGIVMFSVGAIPIGLALLNHQHCDGSH